MHVESLRVGTLSPDPVNANTHPEANIQAIIKSLRRFGQQKPIVINHQGVVIAGNGTLEAAKRLGWTHIDCVRSNLTGADVIAYGIADNKTAQLAEWDDEILSHLLQTISQHGDSELLAAAGFDAAELDKLLATANDPAGAGGGSSVGGTGDPDAIPATPASVITRPGDIWHLGGHRLMCGSCREAGHVDALLDGEKATLAFTSPPYASQRKYDPSSGFVPIRPDAYVEWWGAVQENVKRCLADNGAFFVNIKPHCEDGQRVLYVFDLVLAMVRQWGWKFVDEFCWRNTKNGVPGGWNDRFKNAFEPVYQFAEGKTKFNPLSVATQSDECFEYSPENREASNGSGLKSGAPAGGLQAGLARPSNVLEIPAADGKDGHSAAFPVALPTFFIKAFTDEGDVVFEPFCGSGTTLIACEQLGRTCYGMEISPAYCDIIVARWEKLTGRKAVRGGIDV